jgi:hypothetical protein
MGQTGFFQRKLVVRKRPTLIWIISIFFFLAFVSTMASFFIIIVLGKGSLTPAQEAYYENLSVFDYALSFIPALLNLLGAIHLLKLSRFAFHLFATALGINLVTTVQHLLFTDYMSAFPGAGLFLGTVVAAAICLYAWRLTRKGVLV